MSKKRDVRAEMLFCLFNLVQQRGILSAHVRAILEQLNPTAIVYT